MRHAYDVLLPTLLQTLRLWRNEIHAESLRKRCCYDMKLVLMVQVYASWRRARGGRPPRVAKEHLLTI
jgi:hypothetical protein